MPSSSACASASWPTTTATVPPPARVALRGSGRMLGAAAQPCRLRGARPAGARLRTHTGHRGPGAGPGSRDLLVTVDNGIASLAGVARCARAGAGRAGHRPPPAGQRRRRPGACCRTASVIVNPNQPDDCGFASKALAGVGVMFYVLLATRAELRARVAASNKRKPSRGMDVLLDLVALGTVADVVASSMPTTGAWWRRALKRIRSRPHAARRGGACSPPRRREPPRALSAFDFGFALGPRINAAGPPGRHDAGHRVPDHRRPRARTPIWRTQLDTINRERREVEAGMREQAESTLADLDRAVMTTRRSRRRCCRCTTTAFHEGVVGIVAGRREGSACTGRPSCSRAVADGRLKGSGRSIPGFHLRDALDLVSQAPSRAVAEAFWRPRDGRRLRRSRPTGLRDLSPPPSSRWRREWLDAGRR